MKKQILILASVVLVSTMLFNGCTKEGQQGPQGIQGAQGTSGKDGSANVQSISITIHSWDWKYSSTYKQWYYNYSNSSNYQSAVIGYVMSGNGKQVLPYVDNVSSVRYTMATYLFGIPPSIQFQFTNYNSPTTAPSSDEYFYLVIIPPAMKKANSNVNLNNYEEVKKYYNLN